MATCGHVPEAKRESRGWRGLSLRRRCPASAQGPWPVSLRTLTGCRLPPPRQMNGRVSKPAWCGAGRRGALSGRDWPEGERGLHPASARGRPGVSEVEWSLVLLPQSPGMGTAGAAPRLAQELGRGTSGLPHGPQDNPHHRPESDLEIKAARGAVFRSRATCRWPSTACTCRPPHL